MADRPQKRGPKDKGWYRTAIRKALLSYPRVAALARSPLCAHPAIKNLADTLPHDQWQPEAHALRKLLREGVSRALALADEPDRILMEPILRGVLRGDHMKEIARKVGFDRGTIQHKYWPQAADAVAEVLMVWLKGSDSDELRRQPTRPPPVLQGVEHPVNAQL